MVCGNIFIGFSLALRSHDQFKASHWSTPPPSRQTGGATQWRVCYQRGLPRLVSKIERLILDGLNLSKFNLNQLEQAYLLVQPL